MKQTEQHSLEKYLEPITARIQDNIKRVRKALGMTQFDLYHISGVMPQSTSAIEHGRIGVGVVTLARLVYAFNKNYGGPLGRITIDDIMFTDKLNIRKPRVK